MKTALLERLQDLFSAENRFSTATIAFVMIVAAVLMGVYSLTSLNDKAMMGYQVNKLETARQELVKDGEVTDMLILRARAYETIEQSAIVDLMVKPSREQIVYVTPVTVVAQK